MKTALSVKCLCCCGMEVKTALSDDLEILIVKTERQTVRDRL